LKLQLLLPFAVSSVVNFANRGTRFVVGGQEC